MDLTVIIQKKRKDTVYGHDDIYQTTQSFGNTKALYNIPPNAHTHTRTHMQ